MNASSAEPGLPPYGRILDRAPATAGDAHPVFPESKRVVIEWRRKGEREWEFTREVDEREAPTLEETYRAVWPHGTIRTRPVK